MVIGQWFEPVGVPMVYGSANPIQGRHFGTIYAILSITGSTFPLLVSTLRLFWRRKSVGFCSHVCDDKKPVWEWRPHQFLWSVVRRGQNRSLQKPHCRIATEKNCLLPA